MTAAAGFLLAASIKGTFDPGLFLAILLGASLVIACGCVINNYIDRGIDQKMARTKKRAMVTGIIPVRNAIIYAVILGISGFLILALYTNALTVIIGVIGLFFYLVMYSVWKRLSVWGTMVGSVSGATPIVAGYTAVTNRFDVGAFLLFLILVLWQMPHFYAIAMYRLNDYKAAGLPVLPVKKGMRAAKLQIMLYIVAFIAASAMLTLFGYTGYTYLLIISLIGLAWLWRGLEGIKTTDDKPWGRQMFFFSLIVILTFSVTLATGALLP